MELTEKYTVKDLFDKTEDKTIAELEGSPLTFGGYVRFNRFSGNIGFLTINDGSCFENLQIVPRGDRETSCHTGSQTAV